MTISRGHASGKITDAELDQPAEFGGRRRKSIEIAGEAATMRSEMVRSDPTDPGRRGRSRRPR